MSQPHDDDDDGTVIRPVTLPSALPTGSKPSSQMGEAGSSESGDDSLSLRIGTHLGEFEIVERIGEGGFSIVYLAMDHSLERTVALKEYMPSSLAVRVGSTQVQPRSQRYRDTFEAGLKSFVNEAKLLAHFDHPSLVKVYRFWEANGTAYMVMPYYQGVTVKEAIRALPGPPDEAWLMTLLGPLTEALGVIHDERCYHRDIAPDNVILLAGSGKPLLLDFGAARRVISDMTQALTVILKAGYAPVEQYAEVPGMKQGPWTDVYALAAVVYWAITGKTPPASVGRMISDSHVPLAECAAGRYSPRFLRTIDRALVVLPDRRTQSIAAFRQELGLSGEDQTSPPRPMQWVDPDVTVIRPPIPKSGVSTGGNVASTGGASRPTDPIAGPAVSGRIEPVSVPNSAAGIARQTGTVSLRPLRHADPRPTDNAPHPRQAATHDSAVPQVPGKAYESRPRGRLLVIGISTVGAAIAVAGIWWALQRPGMEPPRSLPEAAVPNAPPPEPTTKQGVANALPPVAAPDRITPPADPSSAAPADKLTAAPIPEPSRPTPPSASTRDELAPDKPPTPYSKKSPPLATEAVQPGARPAPATKPMDAVKPKSGQTPSANQAECDLIIQRLSLESSSELIERLKTLNCR